MCVCAYVHLYVHICVFIVYGCTCVNVCLYMCILSGSRCGRADSVLDSHTTGPGFKTRLVRRVDSRNF